MGKQMKTREQVGWDFDVEVVETEHYGNAGRA